MNYTKLNEIIEEFRKKWEIKGSNIWWEEPFKRCFEAGYYEALDDNDILYGDDAKRFLDNMKKTEESSLLGTNGEIIIMMSEQIMKIAETNYNIGYNKAKSELKTQVLDKIDELNKKGCEVYDNGKDCMNGFWKEDYDKFIKEIKEIFENG